MNEPTRNETIEAREIERLARGRAFALVSREDAIDDDEKAAYGLVAIEIAKTYATTRAIEKADATIERARLDLDDALRSIDNEDDSYAFVVAREALDEIDEAKDVRRLAREANVV